MKYKHLRLIFLVTIILAFKCTSKEDGTSSNTADTEGMDSLSIRKAFASSPVLSAEESINSMQVKDGFEVKVVAAEPLTEAPVALTFDNAGRIWVVEMPAYMPDVEGFGEKIPKGKIAILEDSDDDGIFDNRKVFLDSLMEPRALCLVDEGILVAEPPNLWFFEIDNDKPGSRVLVDAQYTEGHNPEAQENGLFRAMDNWIYSAGSEKRYRKEGTRWLVERTHARGQWGLTQDDFGHLFYNNNSQNLLGDFFLPGLGAANANQQRVAGFNERIVGDNRVYPVRPTPGVNRGYQRGVLGADLKLVNFTAACGPVVYRGALFGDDYQSNAFVAEPAANLIKRNVLKNAGYTINGNPAYKDTEFLASTDERFRPVSLYNGPDGALYIVDMYRGVIQWQGFLTDYLKREIHARSLEQPLTCGRIYKVIPADKKPEAVQISDNPDQLVALLRHSNGWVRDRAQQTIVDKRLAEVVPALRTLLEQTKDPVTITHALWTLEGLSALRAEDVLPFLTNADWRIREQALGTVPSVISSENYERFASLFHAMIDNDDSLAAPYVTFLIGTIGEFDKNAAEQLLLNVIKKYPGDRYVASAAISNLKGRESSFYNKLPAINPDTNSYLNQELKKTLMHISDIKNNGDQRLLERRLSRGVRAFRNTCVPCHGSDGNGVANLAPPLNRSEWVNGDKSTLIKIVLFGLTGPVKVNGKLYEPPEISGDMPAVRNYRVVVNEDIAQLLTYIRSSWGNSAPPVTADEVARIRHDFREREKPFTMEELMNTQP